MAGRVLLQDAATTGNGNEWNCRGVPGTYTLHIVGAGTISTGAVLWEQAQSSGYSGTWSPLASEATPVSGALTTQAFTGNPQWVRCRITTNVTGSGGSVTVKMVPPLEMTT